jgi:hypothetical protein
MLDFGGGGLTGMTTGVPPTLKRDQTLTRTPRMTVPATAMFSRPYFSRPSIVENRYSIQEGAPPHGPASMPAFLAHLQYSVAGVPVDIRAPVTRREAQLPYGSVMRELAVVPARAVPVSPRQAIVPQAATAKSPSAPGGAHEQRALRKRATGAEAACGMEGRPGLDSVFVHAAGEKSRHEFLVAVPAIENREYRSTRWRPPTAATITRATTSSSTAISRRATSITTPPRASAAST